MNPMHTLLSLSLIENPEDFSFAFRNFLDGFYAQPDPARVSVRPAGTEQTRNADLAATADFLCNRHRLRKPEGLVPVDGDPSLVAGPPYFASSYYKTRVWLLADSPQEFRQRNIFIGADSLSRTRQ